MGDVDDDTLSSADALLLGVEVKSDIPRRAQVLHLMYHNPRFAPINRERTWQRMEAAIRNATTRDGAEALLESYQRKPTVYCGNGYVPHGERQGTQAECLRKGANFGNFHGGNGRATLL